MKEEEILGILPLHIRTIIKQADINWDELQEIRLRIQKPVILKYNAKTCYLSEQGKITTRKEQFTYRNLTRDQTSHGIYQQLFDVCLYRTVKTRILTIRADTELVSVGPLSWIMQKSKQSDIFRVKYPSRT